MLKILILSSQLPPVNSWVSLSASPIAQLLSSIKYIFSIYLFDNCYPCFFISVSAETSTDDSLLDSCLRTRTRICLFHPSLLKRSRFSKNAQHRAVTTPVAKFATQRLTIMVFSRISTSHLDSTESTYSNLFLCNGTQQRLRSNDMKLDIDQIYVLNFSHQY